MTKPRIMKAILGLVAVGLCSLGVNSESPTVDLTLVAPWSAPDLLVEIAETIATHNESAYFDFLQDFISLEQKSTSLTPQQVYEEALKVVSSLGNDETNFFKLSLAIHEAAPRMEAYNQYYRESVMPALSQYDDQCKVWVQLGNRQFCDIHQFTDALSQEKNTAEAVDILPFDHVVYSPGATKKAPNVVIYTDRFSAQFEEFYKALNDVHDLSYIIRYRPSILPSSSPLYLAGYGVEMALKKTDYLVIDDRSSQDAPKDSIKDRISNIGKKVGQSLFHSGLKAAIEPLTPAEIQKLGLKAAQYIAKSANPLETLTQLSQDFPKYAKSISAIELDRAFEEEVLENQASFLRAGLNAMWLNGKGLEFSQIDPFNLVRAVRSEHKLVKSFQDLGFTPKEAIDIMSNPGLTKANRLTDDASNIIYDVRDTPEAPFVIWWNDLEKDHKYSSWTSNLQEYLKPTYPGQLHPVKRNAFNLIMVEDLSQTESLARIVNELQMMIKRLVPVRFGIVALLKEDDSISTIMAQSLYYIIEEYGKGNGMKFLAHALETTRAKGKKQPTIDIIEEAFENTIAGAGKPKSDVRKGFKDALETQEAFVMASRDFLNRMGITEFKADNGVMFMNGKLLEFSEEKPWIQTLMPTLAEVTRTIQTMVYSGDLGEDFDLYEFIMSQPNVVRNRNSYITPSHSHPLRVQGFANARSSNELQYFQSPSEAAPSVNLWVVTNFDTASGLRLASEALSFAKSNPQVRIAFVHNSAAQFGSKPEITIPIVDGKTEPTFSDLLGSVIFSGTGVTIDQLEQLVVRASENYAAGETVNGDIPLFESIIPGSPIIEMVAKEQSKKWESLTDAFKNDGLQTSFSGIIINGRIVGPLPAGAEFTKDDFDALFNLEYAKRIAPIQEAISETERTSFNGLPIADVLTAINALIETDKADTPKSVIEDSEPVNRNRVYQLIGGTNHTRLALGDLDNSFLEIGLIIDPLSEVAQKWAHMLKTLAEIEGVSVVIHLNPLSSLEELPLKRFYRYVFDKEPHFDPTTGVQTIPTAYFAQLPIEPLYTLGVETTNAWHVTVREANMDLDNILLSSLKEESGVSAVYELESILIEGHCLDSTNKSPPRGLEFEIATPSNRSQKDTLVMANLGYFQLKALPGIWNLGLRKGRSSTIYSIEDIGTKGKWNWDSTETNSQNNNVLALTSFEGLTVMPLVHKNPGMEAEDVLESAVGRKPGEKAGLWSSLSGKLFGKKDQGQESNELSKPKQAEINIFSVASGKLYERFLSIMITSVMKHTKSTVKFWFIENFLSPEFKDFVPHLAKQYGFDYEMVTYKWPSWLRAQHEKQRTIWGYKILFLDVLFPLSLDKVIFVDADQIVRTDLKELIDMDLQGAPYGYTPFCSDRTEMDGFRFWSEGYWKSHLRGKPYHISALYVVDLVRFRQLAAGDRLRAQYQQLSADPNSLANLDQDLPNNMQHIVPIFSLPQEWLWCETWCSDESLKKAKTIDLCNNPLTKEPKLDRARRQIPEWESYDDEIDRLRKQVHAGVSVVAKDTGDQITASADEKHIKDEL